MAEQKEQIAKEGFQVADAKYMGLADEPKKGKTEKGEWRRAKLRFLLDGRNKENKFTIFTPLTSDKTSFKSDEELVLFERYKIVWVESNQDKNGQKWVDKQIVVINKSTDPAPQQNNQQAKKEDNPLNPDMVKKVLVQYKAKAGDKDNLNHFIGTVLMTLAPNEVKFIKEIYENEGGK